ncbi:permease for cytosine/purines, uracil, thiamine, allantoin-domain-containing protein [Scheffersomyces amazonensis]|uniref:permease for cytosine/purines, uracil, thiamine, allantoin-domain-containing protein n=1 Tax=Scheffersomyces amazonensis TaxID=1078765 RepID=UPI00315DEEC1
MPDQEKEIALTKERSKNESYEVISVGESNKVNGLNIFNKIAARVNAETKGIELVTDEEKTETSIFNVWSMWFSANLVIATFSLGALGITVFNLSFAQAVLVIIFFSLIGVIPVATYSVFGPKLGLRQMILSKFLVGDYAMRIFSFINMVAGVGWGAVNIMSSAQVLSIVNNGACPPWAGCLILVLCTILVSFFGYHVIHIYENWSWVPNLGVFIAIIVRMAKSGNFTMGTMVGGATTAGHVLSFGGAVFGFATGWATFAADYTVYQPRNVPALKIFFAVMLGLWIPLLFTLILGSACATGITTDKRWAELYTTNSIGGLLYAILVEDSLHGFGQFLCVLLALSTVGNNIPNMYSMALSAQATWSKLSKIPRVAWTVLGNCVTLAICIPAYYHFAAVMQNFMHMIGYYLAIYEAISFSEHFIWNKGRFDVYDYEHFYDKEVYPKGYAGIFGFCCGVVGVAVGMNQVWYTSILASKIGEYGGDIGFELAFAFAFVGFNLTRPLEKKYTGR